MEIIQHLEKVKEQNEQTKMGKFMLRLNTLMKWKKTDNKELNFKTELELKYESEQAKGYEVKETPFTIVEEQGKWFVVMGKYRLSETLGTKEEAIEDAERTDWMRLMQIVQLMIDNNKK